MSKVSYNNPAYHMGQSGNLSVYEQTLREKNLQLTKFYSIIHQQNCKMPRYSSYFICKETTSSVQYSQECFTILQVDYLQITQQAPPMYIPHNDSLQEHTTKPHGIQRITSYCPYYLSSLTFTIKIFPRQHPQLHQNIDWHD